MSKNLFSHISYSINDADALTIETEDSLKGIITAKT